MFVLWDRDSHIRVDLFCFFAEHNFMLWNLWVSAAQLNLAPAALSVWDTSEKRQTETNHCHYRHSLMSTLSLSPWLMVITRYVKNGQSSTSQEVVGGVEEHNLLQEKLESQSGGGQNDYPASVWAGRRLGFLILCITVKKPLKAIE